MSVDAFTVDGKVTIDTTPFESGIAKVTSQLSELSGSLKSMMEMGGGNWNFNGAMNGLKALKDDIATIKQDIATMNSEFANTQAINTLKSEIQSLRTEMDAIKEKVSEITANAVENVEKVNATIMKSKAEVGGISEQIAKVTEGIVSLMTKEEMSNYVLEQQQSELGQINAKWREIQATVNGYNTATNRGIALLERTAFQLEKQGKVERQNLQVEKERAKGIQETLNTLSRTMDVLAKRNATEQEEIAFLDEQLMLQKEIHTLTQQGGADNLKQAEALMKQLETDTEIYTVLNEEIALEKEKLALLEEQDAVLKKQTADREKQLATSQKGNKLDKMGYLPSRITSMALTMWGYNELMDIYETTSANLNARGSMKYFGDQLMTDNRYLTQTNQTLGQVRRSLGKFGTDLDTLQKKYQKIDMTVIGANAEESAYKYGVEADKLGDLAEAYAIYGSEFVKQGRTQEDSVLAINDALDGEVRRLKEVNIKMDDLVAHGYDGSTASLVDALNEIAKERGYDVTAQNITNLSDAITVLELKISQGLASAFEYIEPLLREVAMDFVYMIDAISWAFGKLNRLWIDFATWLDISFGVQNVQKFGSSVVRVLGAVVTLAITFGIVYKVVKGLKGMLKGLFGMLGKGTDDIAKTTGDVAKTGGTVGKDSGGGFRDNFMKQWSKTGKDIGKMARVFADVVVGMAMAFVIIEEAILIISGIGYTYDALKPQFESGVEFIKEFGLWFALLGGAMIGLSYALDKIPQGTEKAITKGATRLAYGMAIAMGLIAEAIALLIAPMTAIALLGGTASFLGTNLDKGLEVISWIGNALHQIDLPMALFIGGFIAVSLLLGLVQPLTIGLAVGIASALLLVTEAIVMLIPPLGAIALLGGTASMLGEDNIKQGAETIAMIGRVLQVLASAMVNLVIVDLGVLADRVLNFATQLANGGKDAMTTLTEDILPSLRDFIINFNAMDFSVTVDSAKVQAVTTMAEQIPPLFRAVQNLTNSLGGGDLSVSFMGFTIKSDSGLGSKLDALYEDIKAVMDFARKLGGLSTGGGANANAITQTANAIAQLKVKLNLFITTISSASSRVQSASQRLGSALTTGFKTGSASFNSTVVSILAKGIGEVQSRYATWQSGGRASAQKLTDGFKTIGGKLKSTITTEMGYALRTLDSYQDDFYRKGQALGKQLSDGFESSGGLNVGSPANITRTIAKEMEYSMLALDNGKQMMYKGGQALGQALTNGYNSYGNIKTDIGILAQKGVSSEQLQANAKNLQANTNGKGQVPQLSSNTINIDMSNSTVIGVQDLDAKIRQAVEKAIVSINSPNGAIGY